MGTSLLNQYKASYADSTDFSVNALSLSDALVALASAHRGEPTIIQKTAEGIAVAMPDPAIGLKTIVTDTSAETAGCKATPYTIDSVKNGEKVWFTAIPTDDFVFVGWYLDNELLSTETSYEGTISYSGLTPTILVYEARFEHV